VHIILMQRDAWYKTWYIRGVSYAILTMRNSCSVGYLLPSLETFHSATTEKIIRLFTDVTIHKVACYVMMMMIKKKKKWHNETAVLPSLNKYSRCYKKKNIRPILGTLCAIIRRPPIFKWWIRKKCSSYIRVNTVYTDTKEAYNPTELHDL
jgi:hypothetical protein